MARNRQGRAFAQICCGGEEDLEQGRLEIWGRSGWRSGARAVGDLEEGRLEIWGRGGCRIFSPSPCGLRLSHKCGTIFLRITNGMTGRPSPVAQRLPADRSESHLPPEDFSTVIEGTSQHTSAIYSFRICATPVALAGGGQGEGFFAIFVRYYPSPPTLSLKGRGRIFSVRHPISKCVDAVAEPGRGDDLRRGQRTKFPAPSVCDPVNTIEKSAMPSPFTSP